MKSLSIAGAALAGLLVSVPALVPVAAYAAPGDSFTVDTAAAANLAARINAEIAKLPATAAVGDVESAIIFAIGASTANFATINAALAQVSVTSPAVAKALTNVRVAIAERQSQGGSIGNRGNYGSQSFSSSFSAPMVSVGGGSGYVATRAGN